MSNSTSEPDRERAISILKTIRDPEIGIDIWTMGLVYKVHVDDGKARITMTFTTPTCPYGPQLLEEVESQLKAHGFQEVEIHITFTPLWRPSEELKDLLGMGL